MFSELDASRMLNSWSNSTKRPPTLSGRSHGSFEEYLANPQALEDYFDDSVRVPRFFTDRGADMTEKSLRKAMERMKVYKTLAHWRHEYHVMWSKQAEDTSCSVALAAALK